jgi:hypothetical protein
MGLTVVADARRPRPGVACGRRRTWRGLDVSGEAEPPAGLLGGLLGWI